MKNWIKKNILDRLFHSFTPAIKYLVLINVGVALFFYFFYLATGIELHYYFSTYPTYSDHFHFYQLCTFMFVHSFTNPTHVIFNVLYLLIFSSNVEKRIGFKSFIISYFLCAWIGFVFINHAYHLNRETVNKQIVAAGIKPDKIPINNRNEVAQDYFNKLNPAQKKAVEEYNHVSSKTNGASGALFGIIVMYLLFNALNYRKVVFLLFGLYTLYSNYQIYIEPNSLINGSCLAHFGGMLGGLILFLFFVSKQYFIKSRLN